MARPVTLRPRVLAFMAGRQSVTLRAMSRVLGCGYAHLTRVMRGCEAERLVRRVHRSGRNGEVSFVLTKAPSIVDGPYRYATPMEVGRGSRWFAENR
jgi:hypothetical protein